MSQDDDLFISSTVLSLCGDVLGGPGVLAVIGPLGQRRLGRVEARGRGVVAVDERVLVREYVQEIVEPAVILRGLARGMSSVHTA